MAMHMAETLNRLVVFVYSVFFFFWVLSWVHFCSVQFLYLSGLLICSATSLYFLGYYLVINFVVEHALDLLGT